jgi:hypothetical protein
MDDARAWAIFRVNRGHAGINGLADPFQKFGLQFGKGRNFHKIPL